MRIVTSLCHLILAFSLLASMPVSAVIIVDTPPDIPPPGTPPASTVLVQDAGWYGSCYSGIGAGAGGGGCALEAGEALNSMAFDLTGPAMLKVTALGAGDTFEVFINSVLTFTTSTPNINAPIFAVDPDAAFASPDYSSESLLLQAGSYSVDIFSTAVNLSGVGVSAIEIQTIPIPAAIWLFGSGLIGLIGIARRKKA